ILRNKLKDAQNVVNEQPYYNERKRIVAVVLNDYVLKDAKVFHLPKSIMKEIERVLKGFLWNQGDGEKLKFPGKLFCKPKMKGGLGFKDLGS
ncbi:hypothetical protein Tco_0402480, partial [Tanacetum coccineum]